jgi:NADPH:quinone reductase-like Zn-dependent oxidoreductase
LGAKVVGTVSTHEKADVARAAGCHHPVVRSEQSFVDVVREVTDGEGCAVVYEAIGKDTLQHSLDSLRPMGVCAAYGRFSPNPTLGKLLKVLFTLVIFSSSRLLSHIYNMPSCALKPITQMPLVIRWDKADNYTLCAIVTPTNGDMLAEGSRV